MTSRSPEATVVGRAWRQLVSLLDRPAEAPRGAPQVAGDSRAAKAAPETGGQEQQQLEGLAHATANLDSVAAGRVHLLSLEAVKSRLGKRWDSTAERVHSLVEAELSGRLSRRDFHSRTNETSYVVVFGDCSEAEAKLKIALLTEAILSKLFGAKEAEELRALSVRSVVSKADGQLATRPLESTEALLSSLAAAQPLEPGEEQPGAGLGEEEVSRLLVDLEGQLLTLKASGEARQQPRLKADRLHEILQHLKGLEGSLSRRLDELVGTGAPERPEIALNPGLIRVAHRSLTSLRRIKLQAEIQLGELEQEQASEPAEDGLDFGEAELEVLYRPLWHVPTRKIGVYRPEARLVTASGHLPTGDAAFGEELEEAIDRLVLLQSRRDLEGAIDSGTPAILAVPIHYGTLARIGSQRRYLDLCRNIRAQDRRFIIWQLDEVPRQAFQGQLRAFTGLLRPFGRSLSVTLTLTEQTLSHLAHDLEQIALSGVAAVGFDARQAGAGEKDLIKLFDYVAQLAEAVKLKCFATGLETHSLVLAASCAGFNYVSGPAIAEPLAKLGGVQAAGLEQIYFGQAASPAPEKILG